MRLISFIALAGIATLATAQQPPAAPFVTKQLAKDVYWVSGGGGNSGILIGKKGVIVIDAKTTPAGGKELLAEIAKVTSKPVTTVILTHSDGDHVNGLAAFPAGLTIIAHENNKKEQEEAIKAGGRGAPPADRLPTQLVTKNKETMTIDGVRLELLHWAPAHTSGDLVVYLPGSKICFTGDIVAMQREDPIIHLEKHGSTEGWIETTKGVIALNAVTYVPGHGDPQTKDVLQKRLDATVQKRDKIRELLAQGKTTAEIREAVGDPAPQPGRGPSFGSLVDIVSQESAKK